MPTPFLSPWSRWIISEKGQIIPHPTAPACLCCIYKHKVFSQSAFPSLKTRLGNVFVAIPHIAPHNSFLMEPVLFYCFSGFLHVRSSLTLGLNPSFYYLFARGLAEWDYLPWQGFLHTMPISMTKIYEKIHWQTAFPCILVMFFDISGTNNSLFPHS